jgi:hypothetical protein
MAAALGLPGAWAADSDPVDAFASRVGGDLVVPEAAEAAFASQDMLCGVCTSPLQLLLQVTALRSRAQSAGALPLVAL